MSDKMEGSFKTADGSFEVEHVNYATGSITTDDGMDIVEETFGAPEDINIVVALIAAERMRFATAKIAKRDSENFSLYNPRYRAEERMQAFKEIEEINKAVFVDVQKFLAGVLEPEVAKVVRAKLKAQKITNYA